jgi:translation initiation factor IF-3
LVEIAANATPPVCKVLDLGKYLFEQNKKERLARKAQTKVEIKEIRLRPKTNEHHRGFKVRDARGWLENGMKVKVTIRFRGREVTYPEIALEDLREIAEDLRDVSTIEVAPSMEGRSMTLVLAPIKAPAKKAAPKEKETPVEKTEKAEKPAKSEKEEKPAKVEKEEKPAKAEKTEKAASEKPAKEKSVEAKE